eukprot:gene32547-42160_t
MCNLTYLVAPFQPTAPPTSELSESRPVRRVMSKEKRKHMIQLGGERSFPSTSTLSETTGAGSTTSIANKSNSNVASAKSEEEAALIGAAIRSNFLFQHLTLPQKNTGELVIRQGDEGDRFYIVDSGRFERVDLFKCLTLGQLQRLADLLNEVEYKKDHRIITQGETGDAFYILVSGRCDCSVDLPSGESKRALLESKPRAANVTAVTEAAFEEVLGPLSSIIDDDRKRRFGYAAANSGNLTPPPAGEVGQPPVPAADIQPPNVTVRVFLLHEVEKLQLRDSLLRFVEATKLLTSGPGQVKVIVEAGGVASSVSLDMIWYSMVCLVSALETLHESLVVYRAVQPESINVDSAGRLVLADYRVCKIGLSGGERTFTVCGAADYLSPEQVSQVGHGYPVDLWGVGVLLYEMAVGSHPFSSNSEVATYTRISSFGSKSFSVLKFSESCPTDVKSLINQLLMPTPEARIGSGPRGFAALKRHPFFSSAAPRGPHSNNLSSSSHGAGPGLWEAAASGSLESPLEQLAAEEARHMAAEQGVDPDLLESFSAAFPGEGTLTWLDGIDEA